MHGEKQCWNYLHSCDEREPTMSKSKSINELLKEFDEEMQYCEAEYMKAWNSIIIDVEKNASKNVKESARRDAQRLAIDTAFVNSLAQYPKMNEEDIWALISLAHKMNMAHLEDFNLDRIQRLTVYQRCISAHQSWNKASGHSFERYIASIMTPTMDKNEVRFMLKSDVLNMIKHGKMYNHSEDLNLIKEWNDNFDLYAVQTNHGEAHIFGCIQVKTSIRDRVGRDDQFSKNAMESNFWVAEAVLNGDFFNLPKYYAMVNGGSITYPKNNWHGVYVMSGVETDGRIYRDDNFNIMANHAVIAAKCFGVNRNSLTRNWKAE